MSDVVKEIKEAIEKIRTRPIAAPCGSEKNPHIVHRRQPDICIQCGARNRYD